MKRMNLLPPELRPRDGNARGSAYIVVGVLAACMVGLLAYGLVITGVRSDENELASMKADTQDAQARVDALSPYRDFAQMKDQREQSVRMVADSRFDYERLTREIMRILPAGVWIGHLEVAPAEPTTDVVEAGADSAVADGAVLPPAMKVSGCAPSQDTVADTLDHLRALPAPPTSPWARRAEPAPRARTQTRASSAASARPAPADATAAPAWRSTRPSP